MNEAPIKCLHTEVWAIDRFRENPNNPNRHPEEQLKILAQILLKTGWRNPIIVSRQSGFIVKGHGRLAAARLAGQTIAPVEIQDYASEAEEMADLIADNRIAELAENDDFATSALLEEMRTDPSFDVMLTGFTVEQADDLAKIGDEVSDGIRSDGETTVSGLANTSFKFGSIRFSVSREEYLAWQEKIRAEVGFNKSAIANAIIKRLGIRT